jgi:hypothetical protein
VGETEARPGETTKSHSLPCVEEKRRRLADGIAHRSRLDWCNMRAKASGRLALCLALLVAPAAASASAGLEISTEPQPIVLGKIEQVAITAGGLPGSGPVAVAVNIGRVLATSDSPAGPVVHWDTPRRRFPQMLCLAIWRTNDPGRVHLARIPLHGHKKIRVVTRRFSTVVLQIGEQRFGPAPSGKKGRVRIPVVVPPGVRRVRVEVTDSKGLVSRRRIRVRRGRYNQLMAAMVPEAAPGGGIQMRLVVASAEAPRRAPRAKLDGERLRLKRVGKRMRWEAVWKPPPGSGEARPPVAVKVWIPGDRHSGRRLQVAIPPGLPGRPDAPPPVVAGEAAGGETPADEPSIGRVGLSLAVSAGMLHNLGALFGPLLSAGVGLDFRLPVGRLGLQLSGGFNWDSQSISTPAGMEPAASTVWLVPLTAGLVYALDRWRVFPYLAGGFLAQLVWTRSRAPFLDQERVSMDFAPGAYGLLGGGLRLGPGSFFLEAGYLWSRLQTSELAMTAGGVTIQAGYRFRILGD